MMLLLILILFVLYLYLARYKPAIALVTCPITFGVVFLLGATQGSMSALIGAPAISIITIFVILFSKYDPDKEIWPQVFVRYFLIILLLLLLSVAILIVSGPLGFLGILVIVFFIGSIIAFCLTSRTATATFVLSTIGASIRQNLPLPMALESALSERNDSRMLILRRIKNWLVQGYSLSESIRKGYPRCPGHALVMIATAEKINQVPQAIEAIIKNMSTKTKYGKTLRPIHPIYPVILIAFLLTILWGVTLFVLPQNLASITEMTDGELPAITRIVMGFSRFTFRYLSIFIIPAFVLIFFVILPYSIYIKLRPRRPEEPYMTSIMADKIKWRIPVLHWFENNYSMVQTIEMLRLSLNAGCTVNEAIANTIYLDVNFCFRERLKDWLEKVEAGYNISQSVETSKLGSALAWAFDDKVNQGNTISILEALESLYRNNYNYYINLARFIMWPSLIVLIGACVGIVVVAMFYPSVDLINHLVNYITP